MRHQEGPNTSASDSAGRAARVDRPRRHHASLPPLRHGSHRAQPGPAAVEHGAAAQQLAAPLDRRHLRLPRGGVPHDDGNAGRSHRAAPPAADGRGRLRARLGDGRLLHQRRHAHRGPGPAGGRGRHAGPFHPLAHPEHVPRPPAAHGGHRRLGDELLGGRGDRAPAGRGHVAALLVGIRLPARGARDGVAAGAGTFAVAGIPRPGRRPARPGQRGPVAGGRPGRHLRAEAGGAGGPGLVAAGVGGAGARPSGTPSCGGSGGWRIR